MDSTPANGDWNLTCFKRKIERVLNRRVVLALASHRGLNPTYSNHTLKTFSLADSWCKHQAWRGDLEKWVHKLSSLVSNIIGHPLRGIPTIGRGRWGI